VNSYCPENKEDWRDWLRANHLIEDSIWLIYRKKDAPNPNLNWSEAVDQALCFGWVDSISKPIDKETYMQYFTKRKPKSQWSKINKDKVQTLMKEGLMEQAGMHSIEIAKENGSWTFLDEVEALVIPEDLNIELKMHKDSMQYFDGLSKSIKKALLYWVHSAKKIETRQKRIIEIVENAGQNRKPKQFR